MKKVLFATTALVATAGVAAADVSLTGSAQMGIISSDAIAGDASFFSDIDVTFTMTGETDNGLTFGANIDLDESDGAGAVGASGAFSGFTQGGESIFISGSYGTLTLGDTDGALDWALQEISFNGAASIGDVHTDHAGYNGNAGLDGTYDGQILRYEYAIFGLEVGASVEIDDTGAGDPVYGIGAKYSLDISGFTVGIGAGYQTVTTPGPNSDVYGGSLSVASDFGLSVAGNYWTGDLAGVTTTYYGVGAAYTYDAFTISALYGELDGAGGAVAGYGVAAAYDLGGGASLHLGFGDDDTIGEQYSFGVNMAF